jgi:8-oxo-dGTP diphosphatase
MENSVAKVYGDKVRVRACGLCWRKNALLMVNHRGLTPGDFWSPPGGGIDFGATINDTLIREFNEETGLVISPGRFLFACEFIERPLHSVELFFEVSEIDGTLKTGHDPELQIIKNVAFVDFDEIKKKEPSEVHGIFRRVSQPADLRTLSGFFTL